MSELRIFPPEFGRNTFLLKNSGTAVTIIINNKSWYGSGLSITLYRVTVIAVATMMTSQLSTIVNSDFFNSFKDNLYALFHIIFPPYLYMCLYLYTQFITLYTHCQLNFSK